MTPLWRPVEQGCQEASQAGGHVCRGRAGHVCEVCLPLVAGCQAVPRPRAGLSVPSQRQQAPLETELVCNE